MDTNQQHMPMKKTTPTLSQTPNLSTFLMWVADNLANGTKLYTLVRYLSKSETMDWTPCKSWWFPNG